MVVSKRKPTLKHLTARLLVLGDKQVGKSASIVRYTTGRYIQEYSGSTSDWLYKHSLGFDPKRNVLTSVELFEQKDIQFSNSKNLQATSSTSLDYSNSKHPQTISLSYRVALDRQIDNELHEKQQMLNKLRWANAYIVIYAIDDISTFNKAIKYLNLIANNINSPQGSRNNSYGSNNYNSLSSNNNNSISNSSNNINCNESGTNTSSSIGGKLLNRLSPGIGGQEQSFGTLSKHSSGNQQHANLTNFTNNSQNVKRPILLLANKRDLEKGGARQVTTADGRLLAMRHQTMFAEISISESKKLIESILTNFVEQIDPACLHVEQMNATAEQKQQQLTSSKEASLIHLRLPTVEFAISPAIINQPTPVWGGLVKLKPVGSTVVQSSKVAMSRLQTSEVRLLKPIGSGSKPAEIVAKSATVSTKSPMTARGLIRDSSESACKSDANAKANNQQGNLQNRYAYLKSSFKRASMAIVSSKAMTRGAKVSKERPVSDEVANSKTTSGSEQQLINNSSKSFSLDLTSPKAIETHHKRQQHHKTPTAHWIRSHMGLSRDCSQTLSSSSDPKLNSPLSRDSGIGGSEPSQPFKKPIFKYKARRRTVAFEEIGANKCIEEVGDCSKLIGSQTNIEATLASGELSSEASLLANKKGSKTGSGGSFDRSSSSLSTATDAYPSPLFVLWNSERASSSVGSASVCSSINSNQQLTANGRQNSRSTLSRASTSGGSYDDSGDEVGAVKSAPSNGGDSGATSSSHNSRKSYQLVKSVQNTLTNLTRSSIAPTQMAKRSICNNLFKYSTQSPSVKTITPLATGLAKTEQIRPIIGFCN